MQINTRLESNVELTQVKHQMFLQYIHDFKLEKVMHLNEHGQDQGTPIRWAVCLHDKNGASVAYDENDDGYAGHCKI